MIYPPLFVNEMNVEKQYTLCKGERLSSKLVISSLFTQGQSFICYPFRVVLYQLDEKQDFPVQLLVSVSKRNFRRAPKRNLLKRRMREAYRQNKHILWEALEREDKQIALGVVYIAKEELPYSVMEPKLVNALKRIANMMGEEEISPRA